MKKKSVGAILLCFIFIVLAVSVSVSAVRLRPMNQMNHPGLTNPWKPAEEGPNHTGVSDYTNTFTWSELCEDDHQYRPINQGYNIPKFFMCLFDGD